MRYVIPPQNQLVMRKTHSNLLWPSISHHTMRASFLEWLYGVRLWPPSPTISPSQWHSRDLNPWHWLWYHLLDHELYYSTSKLIFDDEDTLKSFIAFNKTPRKPVFRMVIGSQIVITPTVSINYLWHLNVEQSERTIENKYIRYYNQI